MLLSLLQRSVVRTATRFASTYPTHHIVGMPALSPTMTTGTISAWKKKVGDLVVPGETIAEIDTDKASMAFEGQDEFYIAKLLVAPGAEVAVGAPVFISVESSENVAAFENYQLAAAPKVAASTPVEKAPVSVPVVQPPKPAAQAQTAPSKPESAKQQASSSVATVNVPADSFYSVRSTSAPAASSSPLNHAIRTAQQQYGIKYGREIAPEGKKSK